MSTLAQFNTAKWLRGFVALFVACLLNYYGDRLLGVSIELFRGVKGFSPLWVVDLFILPFALGFLVTMIYGAGGKWLSYFPPLIVRSIAYYQIDASNLPSGASLIPMGWWGFFVILAIESSAFGGIIGEVMIKSIYGRSPRHQIYKERADEDGDGQE
ncbi:MAG: hypothetical protein LBG66_01435 [Gallionellaceae bacterium]|jgi:hypothetical protein|nr:hypothetical protein [Gallionellaceae bacterium]